LSHLRATRTTRRSNFSFLKKKQLKNDYLYQFDLSLFDPELELNRLFDPELELKPYSEKNTRTRTFFKFSSSATLVKGVK
jgi:hypothetical protein